MGMMMFCNHDGYWGPFWIKFLITLMPQRIKTHSSCKYSCQRTLDFLQLSTGQTPRTRAVQFTTDCLKCRECFTAAHLPSRSKGIKRRDPEGDSAVTSPAEGACTRKHPGHQCLGVLSLHLHWMVDHNSGQIDTKLGRRDRVSEGPSAHAPHVIHGRAAHELRPARTEQLGQAQRLRPPIAQQHLRRSFPNLGLLLSLSAIGGHVHPGYAPRLPLCA